MTTRRKLKECCDFIDYRGKTPEKSESGYRLITAKNVKDYGFSYEPAEYIPKENYDEVMVRGIPQSGDILFTTEAPLGNVCRIPEFNEPFAVGQRIIVIQPKKGLLNTEYFEHLLKSTSFRDQMMRRSSGSTVKGIRSKELVEIEIEFPDIQEQKRIADEINTTKKIIETRQQQVEQFDLLVQSRFVEMFGDPMDESKTNATFTEVVEFNPKKSEVSDMQDTEVSFVPMDHVGVDGSFKEQRTGLISEFYKGYTYFREGDVLIAKITPCFENGKSAIAHDCCNGIGFGTTEFHVARPIEGRSTAEWVKYLLKNDNLHEYASSKMTGSAGQKRIQTPFFENLKVYLPALEEQQAFSDFVKQVEKSKIAVQKALDETQLLFDSLMQEYFG